MFTFAVEVAVILFVAFVLGCGVGCLLGRRSAMRTPQRKPLPAGNSKGKTNKNRKAKG